MSILKQTLLLGVVAAMLAPTHSHTHHVGRECPKVEPMPDFDRNRINGTWVVHYKFDEENKCLLWEFQNTGNTTFMLYEARQIRLLDYLGIKHAHALTATLETEDPNEPAAMRVDWSDALYGKADFIVFDTDYDNFMAVYECDRLLFAHRRSVAILSRTVQPDPAVLARVTKTLDNYGIAHHELDPIVQNNNCKTGQ